MKVTLVFFSLCGLLLFGVSAFGALTIPSYTERVLTWDQTLTAIASASGLDAAETARAKAAAADWMLHGPCQGAGDFQSAQTVSSYEPTNRFQSVVVEMIGYLTTGYLGREPGEDICRYSRDISRTIE